MGIPFRIPDYIEYVLQQLKERGHQACIVGGAVRDLLMDRTPKDFDVVSSAEVQDVMDIFDKVLPIGEKHGTSVVLLDGQKVEITRCKIGYHPGDDWQNCLRGDLFYRDFTINAMAIDADEELVDPFGGQQDIKRRVLRSPELWAYL